MTSAWILVRGGGVGLASGLPGGYDGDMGPGCPRLLAAAAAVALAIATSPAEAAPRRIEDDYARALAEAKKLGVPILVDAWAPW